MLWFRDDVSALLFMPNDTAVPETALPPEFGKELNGHKEEIY